MSGGGLLRVGIIGAGGIAGNMHLPSVREHLGCELVAVCDIRADAAQQAAAEFGARKAYTLYGEMLAREDLDAVYVLTQPDQLFRPALASLNAGKHVFVEKPPGVTVYQAETLALAARRAGRICMVGFNRRFAPVVRETIDWFRANGTVEQVDVQFIKFADAAFYGGAGSAFECDTIHVIDLMRWIAGAEPEAAAMVEHTGPDGRPNAWNAVIRFSNAVTGTVRANYSAGGRVQALELHGGGHSAFVDLGFVGATSGARLLTGQVGTQSLTATGRTSGNYITLGANERPQADEPRIKYGYAAETEEFIAAIREDRAPLTDIGEGVRSMRFVEMLRASRI
jgi:predicted dehydrogenase